MNILPYLLTPFLCAGVAWLCNYLEMAGWRKSAGLHWTERARRLFPARTARLTSVFMTAGTCMFLLQPTPGGWPSAALMALGVLGGALGNFPMDRAIDPTLTLGKWVAQIAGTSLIFLSPYILLLIVLFTMPSTPGWGIVVVTFVFLGIHSALQFGAGLRLMRVLRLLRPAAPRLQAIVSQTSAAMGIPVRATWEAVTVDANALAMVNIGELAFTDKLLAAFSDAEIHDICAHELGHLAEPLRTRLARLAGSLVLFPLIFIAPVFTQWSLAGVAGLFVLTVLILIFKNRHARAMETRADAIAQAIEGQASAYARSLEHLYRVNWMPAVLRAKPSGTHPDLYDRMVASGVTPDYPRPAPPARQTWSGRLLIGLFFAAMVWSTIANKR